MAVSEDDHIMSQTPETHSFQAETQRLLDLMIHSLYSHKEIFLRELVSNASDAIDRLRFESLTEPELTEGDWDPEIRLAVDPEARVLTIRDNGIGMSREEVIDNIGTIAKSGTRELMDRLKEADEGTNVEKLIGQFGVGFYSSFMAADEIELITRRAGEDTATRWHSAGGGTYTVEDAEREGHGTTIRLHLKPADPENGLEDFTDEYTLRRTVKRYSDFVAYPIVLPVEIDKEVPTGETDEAGTETTETRKVTEDKRLNSMKPIWIRPASEVSEQDYAEFYKHISSDWEEPLDVIPFKAEGLLEYQALLFVPKNAPYDLFYVGHKPGLQLYVRRVLIMESCEELLPQYLRFVRGVVDSPDLPLNVSRELLQQDRQISQIQRGLVKKLLDRFAEMAEKEEDKYLEFWGEFGRALKEGVSADYKNRDKLLPLLRFQSSADDEALTSLAAYVERMQDGQDKIYYLTGESREVVENSPHLEAFKERGIEVLYLTDPVDELMVQSLPDFDGKQLRDVGKGEVDLGTEEEKKQSKEELEKKEEEMKPLLEKLQALLDREIKHVRLSGRLTSSPACLVGAEHDYSPQLERLLQKGKGGGPKQRRILELNPQHALVRKLHERYREDPEATELARDAELLLGYAYLAEGSEIPEPVEFNRRLLELMG
jgi:molecular chaperone HtpG